MSRSVTIGNDCDEFGWPKAPIELEEPLTEEQLEAQARRREEILAEHAPAEPEVVLRPDQAPVNVVPFKSHMTQDEFDDLDYPKVPEEWTPDYFTELMYKERVDPRVNPNLLLDEGHREFWNNMARKPFAKAILRSEQHWTDRRNVWLKQYENVELMNQAREKVAGLLEDCPMEVKRLLTPILHHKITQLSLQVYLQEAKERKIPFSQCLEQAYGSHELQVLREAIDAGGDKGAARLLEEYTARSRQEQADEQKRKEEADRGKRVVTDTETVASQLNQAQRLRKDGYIEWHKGNLKEALAAWRQASVHIKHHKLPDVDTEGNRMIAEVHIAVLKNIAQAAIKLGYWTEALTAADDALRIDDQDHKAWFRRACALEGLGRFEEEEEALKVIEDIAVGRPDRERIMRDLGLRREKVQSLTERDKETQKKCLSMALEQGIFSGNRKEQPSGQMLPAPPLKKKNPTDDGPGDYAITQTAAVKAGQALSSRKVRDLRPGTEVKVLEVAFEGRTETRVRARIEQPAGWITLQDPKGHRYATKQPSLSVPKGLRLTKDSAAALVEELRHAYSDSGFQLQVAKLAEDMLRDRYEFVIHLRAVALAVQAPVLEKWGFEPSLEGVTEMQRALRDHIAGDARDAVLAEKVEELRRLLHGDMYKEVFSEVAAPKGLVGPMPPRAVEGLREEVIFSVEEA